MIKGGPKIINNGLVLCLDAHDAKSYEGEPTNNFLYFKKPRIDESYSSYNAGYSAWGNNHPDAITVYNESGSDISSFINGGVNGGNWTVAPHAHWVYDNDLKKPVVQFLTISGFAASWQAMYTALSETWNSYGMSAGDQYTISWLQKSDIEGDYWNPGIYGPTSGGSFGFWDGLPSSGNVDDIKQNSDELNKWVHKYRTYTVSSSWNFGYGLSLYGYGHYSPYGTLRISDFQLEMKSYATPMVRGVYNSTSGVRSATNGWKDRSGNSNHGTLTNMNGTGITHYRDREVIMPVSASYLDFDGTNDYVDIGNTTDIFPSGSQSHSLTVSLWGKVASTSSNRIIYGQQNVANERLYIGVLNGTWEFGWGTYAWGNGNSGNAAGATTNWTNLVLVISNGVADLYVNGVGTISKTDTSVNLQGKHPIGAYYYINSYDANLSNACSIAQCYMYNRALTAAEVLQNYNATKGRFL